MRITNYDIIGNAAPLDAKAATVRDGIGEAGASLKIPQGHLRSDLPLPVTPPAKGDPWTGKTVGFFRVIGQHANGQSGNRRRWVVRCSCGYYETRSTEALSRAAEGRIPFGAYEIDRCLACGQTEKMRQISGRPPSKSSLKRQRDLMRRVLGDANAFAGKRQ